MSNSSECTAQELIQKVKTGARYGNIQLGDVDEVLSNELFSSNEGLLATTDPGKVCRSSCLSPHYCTHLSRAHYCT